MKNGRCSYIYRSGPLHPSIKIGGGVSMGRCKKECFPGLVVCYEHAEKEALALLARKAQENDDKRTFLLLFYRERIGRLAGNLFSQELVKKALRKRHKKNTLKEYDLSVQQIAEYMRDILRRAEDDTKCNDICKSMYFCDLKKGHKGGHSEGPGALGPW